MKLTIPKDFFSNPKPPRLFLCNTGKKILGQLPSYEESLDAKWGSYSTLQFSIDRVYTDVLTSETKVHPLFDKAEGLRKVYAENIGYFIIQDPDSQYSDNDTKTLSCFSSEYETASKYLEELHINTGKVDSAEVIYNLKKHGSNYSMSSLYSEANGFDASQYYYKRTEMGASSDAYVYEQVEVTTEKEYNKYIIEKITLYTRNYENVRFYWPENPELSLLHIVFKKIPEWTIGHVDVSLKWKERNFDEERVSVYDFLMKEVQDTFKCVVEWNTEENKVSFYEEAEDGINEDDTIQTRWDTDVFVSRENLANEIHIEYSADDIKTKLKVTGGDNLNIREANLGRDDIINLDFFHTVEWMEQDLYDAYQNYLDKTQEYSKPYNDAVQSWVAAYNKWDELMNNVPADGNIVRINDPFEKLYCTYSPIDTAYLPEGTTITDGKDGAEATIVSDLYLDKTCLNKVDKLLLSDNDTLVVNGWMFIYRLDSDDYKCIRNVADTAIIETINPETGTVTYSGELIKKLELYQIDKDTTASQTDNILLRLINDNSDIATIRIYNTEEDKDSDPIYQIKCTIQYKNNGLMTDRDYSLTEWVEGKLTDSYMGLEGYKVQYIGTMGAYFVLAKDERVKVNLQDYGIKLLEEKHDIYSLIFQTQTEAMYSQEKYQCIASDTDPSLNASIPRGTMWLDTNSNPIKLYTYKPCIPGDVNNDGVIDTKDCQLVNKHISGSQVLTDVPLKAADVNNDGVVDETDAQLILECASGQNSGFGTTPIGNSWAEFKTDLLHYENYARYIDNYEKLKAVQEVLETKKQEATYWLDGVAVTDRNVVSSDNLEQILENIARNYFGLRYTIGKVDYDPTYPIYTFNMSIADRFLGPVVNDQQTYFFIRFYSKPDADAVGTPNLQVNSKYVVVYSTTDDNPVVDSSVFNNLPRLEIGKVNNNLGILTSHGYYVHIKYSNDKKTFTQKIGAVPGESVGRFFGVYADFFENDSLKFNAYRWTRSRTVDPNTYAVYLKNGTPYISYADSRGVYQAKMDYYNQVTEFEKFFTEDQWARLSPLIREDEFSDSNFLITSFDTEETKLEKMQELLKTASKELKTLSQPSLKFSMNMANILALPEFKPLFNQFQLGNFIRVGVRSDYIKRARLLEVHLKFDNLSNFSANFGNLVTTKSEVDKHAELLAQAVSAGKQVASSASDWQKAVDKTNKIEEDIRDGLANAALEIGRASGQSILWDEYGIWGRKLVEGTTDQYEDEQFRMINNKLVFSNDGFKTSKSVFGKFVYDGVEYYGVLADAAIAAHIEGSTIVGGTIRIGEQSDGSYAFEVYEDGTVSMGGGSMVGNSSVYEINSLMEKQDDINVLVEKKNEIEEFISSNNYRVEVISDGPTIITNPNQTTTLTCKVYSWDADVTETMPDINFNWVRNSGTEGDILWNTDHMGMKSITITADDVPNGASTSFSCNVELPSTDSN